MHELQIRLGYQFNDISLLEQALTHCSYAAEHNERLEFLGDAILDFLIADCLFRRHASCNEGALSQMRAQIVCGRNLAGIGSDLQLGRVLRLGSGEAKSGGRERASNLANGVEAVIAAVYLDGGIVASIHLVEKLFAEHLQASSVVTIKDPKTRLQEHLQSRQLDLPVYRLASRSGKDHAANFSVTCNIPQLDLVVDANGTSVKKAEQSAAGKILALIEKKLNE